MTITLPPPVRSAPAAAPRRARRWTPWLLACGVLAQVAVRLWFARARTGPVANPDETGYLVAARWLAGGPGGDLSGMTFYQAGYPLLLAPAHWLADDPVTVYTTVMVINAALGALLFPLAYTAVRRCGLDAPTALPVAWAAALLPATTFFGAFALADAALPTVTLAWLLALDRFVRTGRPLDATAASLTVAFAAAVHSRGTVLMAVHAATLLLLLLNATRHTPPRAASLQRRATNSAPPRPRNGELSPFRAARSTASRGAAPRRWNAALARVRAVCARGGGPSAGAVLIGAVAAMAGFAAQSVLNARLRAESYPGGPRDLAAILVERVTTADGQARAWSGAAGQLWYLVAGTWGLGGVGLVAVMSVLVRRRTSGSSRIMAGVLLAATLGVAYASSAALPDEHRVGNFAYGRYLACVALAYALIGAAVLLRTAGRAARCVLGAGALLCVTGTWVAAYAGDRLRTHVFIAFDFPETSFLTGDRTALHLAAASTAAAGLLAAFFLLARLPRRGLVLAAGLAAVNMAALTFAMGPAPERVRPVPPVSGPSAGGMIADASLDWRVKTMLLYPVWWTRIEFTRVRRVPPGVCTAVVPWPDGTPAAATWPARPAGWTPEEGRAGSLRWVAWHDPSCRT